jgi:hypothetical protein
VTGVDLTTGATTDLGLPFQHGTIGALSVSSDERDVIEVGSGLIDWWRLDDGGAIRHQFPLASDQFVQEFIGPDQMLVVSPNPRGLPSDPHLVDVATGAVIDPLDHVIWATRDVDQPTRLVAWFDDRSTGEYDMVTRQRIPDISSSGMAAIGGLSVRGHTLFWDGTHLEGVDETGAYPLGGVLTGIRDVVASVDGSRLFALEASGLVQLAADGKRTSRVVPSVDAAASTADLVVAATSGRLQVRDAETLDPSGAEFPGTSGPTRRIDIADDGQTLLVDGVDQTIQLADLPSRSFLGDLIVPGAESNPQAQARAVLAPDGQRMAYNLRGSVVVWDLAPDALRAAACRVAGRDLTSAEWTQYLGVLGPQRPVCPH